MSAQRYERVSAQDAEETHLTQPIPNSPPPSFRSRTSSFAPSHAPSEHDRLVSDADRTLADTFDSPSDDEADDDESHLLDERQRAVSIRPAGSETDLTSAATTPTPPTANGRIYGGGSTDGVFANMTVKVQPGEEVEEKPPTYEQAAADSAPPYWETTILSPGSASNEVYLDGLPVGSLFSFVWNALISMSFQLVGFLLTYLLHTSHAAKHGSKAGLGITLVQYGFTMRTSLRAGAGGGSGEGDTGLVVGPSNPNGHTIDPNVVAGVVVDEAEKGGMASGEWLAYAIMVVGWFVLVKAVAEYVKARRHEQLVLQSPSRGLGVAVVAEGERPEVAV